jgi:hypothetical protein
MNDVACDAQCSCTHRLDAYVDDRYGWGVVITVWGAQSSGGEVLPGMC